MTTEPVRSPVPEVDENYKQRCRERALIEGLVPLKIAGMPMLFVASKSEANSYHEVYLNEAGDDAEYCLGCAGFEFSGYCWHCGAVFNWAHGLVVPPQEDPDDLGRRLIGVAHISKVLTEPFTGEITIVAKVRGRRDIEALVKELQGVV